MLIVVSLAHYVCVTHCHRFSLLISYALNIAQRVTQLFQFNSIRFNYFVNAT